MMLRVGPVRSLRQAYAAICRGDGGPRASLTEAERPSLGNSAPVSVSWGGPDSPWAACLYDLRQASLGVHSSLIGARLELGFRGGRRRCSGRSVPSLECKVSGPSFSTTAPEGGVLDSAELYTP